MSTRPPAADWDEVELGDVVTLHRGYDLPSSQRRSGTVPIVSSSGITGYHDVAKISPPGVVTGRCGTLGEVFFVDEPFWPHNTTLYVSDFHGNDERFVSYFLQCQNLDTRGGAAAVPAINRNVLHRLPVRRPPLPTQHKIAAILSAYDDLIENNNRRIKLLEEMAHRIYREWFVNFHYPGHEDVPLVDSELGLIPAGWAAGRWGQYATLDYGRALRGYKEGTGQYPVFGTNGQIGWHNEALFPPGVVVGRKGAYRGIRMSPDPCWVIDTAFYLRLNDNARIDSMYAYHQLCTVDLDDIDSGSAIPSTSREAFYAIPLVVPPIELVRKFSAFAWNLDSCERVLRKGAENLRASRDLLLPRLISGEVDVSDLDIAMPEAAA